MSNLRYTDKELLEMEKYASLAADREPYHLTYARAYKGNETLNPHLPGKRHMAAGQELQERETNENETKFKECKKR